MSRSHTKAFKLQPLRQDPASEAPLVIPRFRQDCKPQPGKLIWTSCLSLPLQSPHLSLSTIFFFFNQITVIWCHPHFPHLLPQCPPSPMHPGCSVLWREGCMSPVFQPPIHPKDWDQVWRGTHLSLRRLPPLAAPGGSASTPRAHHRASLWWTTECCPLQPQRNTWARVDHFRRGQLPSHRTAKITGKITWFNLCSFNRKSNWLSDPNHGTFSINCGSP